MLKIHGGGKTFIKLCDGDDVLTIRKQINNQWAIEAEQILQDAYTCHREEGIGYDCRATFLTCNNQTLIMLAEWILKNVKDEKDEKNN